MAWSRPPAAAEFAAEAFAQPNPYDPLDCAWQSIIGEGALDDAFGDDLSPPPDCPSPNL